MIHLLWHLRGGIPLGNTVSEEAVLDRVEDILYQEWKPATERGVDFISFDTPLWSDLVSPNWKAFVIYDRGRFWIDGSPAGRVLRYDLRSLHGFVFCLFGAAMFYAFGLSAEDPNALKFAAVAFGWLYGMNILLALIRIPRMIRRAARTG